MNPLERVVVLLAGLVFLSTRPADCYTNYYFVNYCNVPSQINLVRLGGEGNSSGAVVRAYLSRELAPEREVGRSYDCYVTIKSPAGTGIVLTATNLFILDSDQLIVRSGSNPPLVWKDGDQEAVAYPVPGEEPDITVEFKSPSTATHLVHFELVATSFRERDADTPCSSARGEMDCGNLRCIWSDYTCDGHNNCGNEADESGCTLLKDGLIALGILIVALILIGLLVAYLRNKARHTYAY